ncbi:MAG: hypothetical protein KatS3mg110_1151 [Pirellulaceae bacterium]|nr:MAG: hypothetical protein KatS3mg110_1151 [Pirellulaceae bacterium]
MRCFRRRLLSARWTSRCQPILLATVVAGACHGSCLAQAEPPQAPAAFATVHTATSDSETAVSWAVLQDSSANPKELKDVAIDLSVVQQPTPRVWARSQDSPKQPDVSEPPMLLAEPAEDDTAPGGELVPVDAPVVLEPAELQKSASTSLPPAEMELGENRSEFPASRAGAAAEATHLLKTTDPPSAVKLQKLRRPITIEAAVFFPEQQPAGISLVAVGEAVHDAKARRLLVALGLVDLNTKKPTDAQPPQPPDQTTPQAERRTAVNRSGVTRTESVTSPAAQNARDPSIPDKLVQPPEILDQFANVRPLEEPSAEESSAGIAVPIQSDKRPAAADDTQQPEVIGQTNTADSRFAGEATVLAAPGAQQRPIVQMRLGDDVEQEPEIAPASVAPLPAERRVPERVFVNAPPRDTSELESPAERAAEHLPEISRQAQNSAPPADAFGNETATDENASASDQPRRPRPVVISVDGKPSDRTDLPPARDHLAQDEPPPASENEPSTAALAASADSATSPDVLVAMPRDDDGTDGETNHTSPAMSRPRPEIVRVRPPVALMLEGAASPVAAATMPMRTEQTVLQTGAEPNTAVETGSSALLATAEPGMIHPSDPSASVAAGPQPTIRESFSPEHMNQRPAQVPDDAAVANAPMAPRIERSTITEPTRQASMPDERTTPAITRVDGTRAGRWDRESPASDSSHAVADSAASPLLDAPSDVQQPNQEVASVLVKRSSSSGSSPGGDTLREEASASRSNSAPQQKPPPVAPSGAGDSPAGTTGEAVASRSAKSDRSTGDSSFPPEPTAGVTAPSGVPRWDARLLTHRQLDVLVRQASHIRTQQPVARIDVLDRAVCDVIQFSPYELAVVGKQVGVSMVRMWYEGQDNSTNYLVSVRAVEPVAVADDQFEQMRQMIREMFPKAHVEIISETDRIVVRGTATSNEEALQIVSLIRKLRLVPVVDRLVVERSVR